MLVGAGQRRRRPTMGKMQRASLGKFGGVSGWGQDRAVTQRAVTRTGWWSRWLCAEWRWMAWASAQRG